MDREEWTAIREGVDPCENISVDFSIASVAMAVAGSVAGILAIFMDTFVWQGGNLRRKVRDEGSLESKLARLSASIGDSVALMQQVSAELTARKETVEQLKVEADHAQRIVALTQEQKEAVAKLVRAEVASEGKRSTKMSVWVGLLYALAGALITLAVTMFVRPIYAG